MTNTAAPAPADVRPGDVIKYKRDGKFRVIEQTTDGRWTVTADAGKFAGKYRTVTLGPDTVVTERAPEPAPAPTGELVSFMRLAAAATDRGLNPGTDPSTVLGRIYANVNAQLRGDTVAHPFPYRLVDGRKCVDVAEGLTWWAEHATRSRRRAPARKTARQRYTLPAGHVTPGLLAKVINEQGLYTGNLPELPGRFVHSAALRSGRRNPAPFVSERLADGTRTPMHAPLGDALRWWLVKSGAGADEATATAARIAAPAELATSA